MSLLLAADVGGTKTDLAVYDTAHGLENAVVEATFASGKYSSFALLLEDFFADGKLRIDRACFGVAGPVLDNRVRLTNLPWQIDGDEIAGKFAMGSVVVINDLVALGSAIPFLQPDDVRVLHAGNRKEKGAVGVVAPGTGLGMAFLVWNGAKYQVCPSEGGHAGFAPGRDDAELFRFLQAQNQTTSIESLCSGQGLPNIYVFLRDSGLFPEPEWLKEELAGAHDPTPVIVAAAMDPLRKCHICRETVRSFVGILADVCGNLALTVVATGGMYIGGGIPSRILPFLLEDDFHGRFAGRGKMSGLLADVPVAVIINSKAALLGAAAYGLGNDE